MLFRVIQYESGNKEMSKRVRVNPKSVLQITNQERTLAPRATKQTRYLLYVNH